MATTVPTLTTECLILRPWRDSDLAPFAALNADPEVMEHFPTPLTPVETEAMVGRIQAQLAQRGFGWWAAEAIGVAPFIGFIGLSVPDFGAHFLPPGHRVVEVGWRLARDFWGKGYATEGAREALRFGFEALGLPEIVSFTTTTNTRSQAVMQRLGMTRDPADDFDHPKLPPGHRLRPHVLYRLKASAWRTAMTRTYFACLWHHDHPNEPVELYSELDGHRWELRKVEVFRDGRGQVAGPGVETGDTRLGSEACPTLGEIAADPRFEPREISREEFEAVWRRHAG